MKKPPTVSSLNEKQIILDIKAANIKDGINYIKALKQVIQMQQDENILLKVKLFKYVTKSK